jgi:chromosome segregation ATPase
MHYEPRRSVGRDRNGKPQFVRTWVLDDKTRLRNARGDIKAQKVQISNMERDLMQKNNDIRYLNNELNISHQNNRRLQEDIRNLQWDIQQRENERSDNVWRITQLEQTVRTKKSSEKRLKAKIQLLWTLIQKDDAKIVQQQRQIEEKTTQYNQEAARVKYLKDEINSYRNPYY